MMDTETAHLLSTYNAWADQTLFAAVAKLPQSYVYRQTKTLFESIAGTLNHNYLVDLIWQAHLLGKTHGFSTRRDLLYPKLEDLLPAQILMNNWLIGWASEQTSASLNQTAVFRFISGQEAIMQKGSILLHVVNHKTYHRGWVSEMFFEIGVEPPETDFSVYLCPAAAH
jgi:uncharacterized damage-inducible protein DinB